MSDPRTQWPWLDGLGKPTVRLRPRPFDAPYDLLATRIGGLPLLPSGAAWPQNRRGETLVFVAQLRREDVPCLSFPPDAGWLQVYWDRYFPFDPRASVDDGPRHSSWDSLMPRPRVLWVPAVAGQHAMRPSQPDYSLDNPLVPLPCVCDLEEIVDYPHREDGRRLGNGSVARDEIFRYEEAATAQGSKAGGWPFWLQHPQTPRCRVCGHAMDHLLTLASTEAVNGSGSRWNYAGSAAQPVKPEYPPTNRTGLDLHDTGHAYFFYCRQCPERPIEWVHQNF